MINVTISAVGRLALFASIQQRLLAVRTITGTVRDLLLLFCIVDEHIHSLLSGDSAARRAHQLWQALQAVSDVPLEPPHLVPVETRTHLANLVPYVLTQPKHHGLSGHPALWVGSCFPDLVGARELVGFDRRLLAEALPRRPVAAWEAVGLTPCEPAGNEMLEQYGPKAIVSAAAAAIGRESVLGETPQARRARRAAAVILHQLGYNGGQIADALGVSDGAGRRLAGGPTTSIERCIRMQLAIRQQVTDTALAAFDRKQLTNRHR